MRQTFTGMAVRAAAIAVFAVFTIMGTGASFAHAEPHCRPGTGKPLAGRTLTAKDVSRDMRCADLRGAKLPALRLAQTDFSGANLDGADLTGAQLIQVKLVGASLHAATLRGATLIQATLTGANFTGAQLSGANLTQATLTGANFTDANLTGAQLIQARGTNVNLTRADLSGANRTQASIAEGPGATLPALPPEISAQTGERTTVLRTETMTTETAQDTESWSVPVSLRSGLLTGGVLAALVVTAAVILLLAGRRTHKVGNEHGGMEIGDTHPSSGHGSQRHPYEARPL